MIILNISSGIAYLGFHAKTKLSELCLFYTNETKEHAIFTVTTFDYFLQTTCVNESRLLYYICYCIVCYYVIAFLRINNNLNTNFAK